MSSAPPKKNLPHDSCNSFVRLTSNTLRRSYATSCLSAADRRLLLPAA
jgi:hypothetical protein